MSLGAYGLQLIGADGAGELLLEVPAHWPQVEIIRRSGRAGPVRTQIGDERAEILLLGDAQLVMDRVPLRAIFTTPMPLSDEELVHPYLAPAANVAGRWLGRECFHAGAFVLDGGVWGVLGEQESGKSSTLAWLALDGHHVFSDDALIVSDGEAYAGPRSIDLRGEAAHRFGVGDALGVVGERERWRIRLDSVTTSAPLRGWVFLEWSETIELVRVPAKEALGRLFAHRAVLRPPKDPVGMLELLMLPTWALRRPQRWNCLGEASRRLLEVAA